MGRRVMLLMPLALIVVAAPMSSGQSLESATAPAAFHESDAIDPCLAPEDLRVVERVRARMRELDQREQMLVVREQAIDVRRATVDEETRRLEDLRATVEEMLQRRTDARDAGLDSLVKMVDQMKPAAAAEVIERMERHTAAAILERLGSRQAGKVLGAMSPDIAAELAGLLAADSDVLHALEDGP